jgi:hypothetical protein
MNRRIRESFHRRAEGYLDAQIALGSCYGHSPHGRWPRCVLCRGTGQQEHQGCCVFLNGCHSLLSLAGAPTCRLNFVFPLPLLD